MPVFKRPAKTTDTGKCCYVFFLCSAYLHHSVEQPPDVVGYGALAMGLVQTHSCRKQEHSMKFPNLGCYNKYICISQGFPPLPRNRTGKKYMDQDEWLWRSSHTILATEKFGDTPSAAGCSSVWDRTPKNQEHQGQKAEDGVPSDRAGGDSFFLNLVILSLPCQIEWHLPSLRILLTFTDSSANLSQKWPHR